MSVSVFLRTPGIDDQSSSILESMVEEANG